MKQKQFEMQNEALWDQIKTILEERHKKKNAPAPLGIQEFPALYRRLCQNLVAQSSTPEKEICIGYC